MSIFRFLLISFHICFSHSLSSCCSCHGECAVLAFLVCSCSYAFDISLNRSLPISNVNPLCSFHLSGWNSLARRRYARVISLAVALRCTQAPVEEGCLVQVNCSWPTLRPVGGPVEGPAASRSPPSSSFCVT